MLTIGNTYEDMNQKKPTLSNEEMWVEVSGAMGIRTPDLRAASATL